MDLLESAEPGDINKYPAKDIKELKLKWKERVQTLQSEAYSEKEKVALREESVKYELLEKLKNKEFPGPFAKEDDVKNFMLLNYNDDVKNKRLYIEVRYPRIICMSLKRTAAVFRPKRNHRNLRTEEYAENLISFLSNARLCKTVTMTDLTNIMHGIIGKSGIEAPTPVLRDEPEEEAANQTSSSSPDRSHIQYQCGEHVIAFWLEGNTAKWYLGVVEGISDGKILMSYMSRADTKGKSWTFPQAAEVLQSSPEQILASKVKVQSLGTVTLRCCIVADELVAGMDSIVKDMN